MTSEQIRQKTEETRSKIYELWKRSRADFGQASWQGFVRDAIAAAFAESLAAAPSGGDGARTFWVIERFVNSNSAGFWTGASSRDFIADIEKSVQFHRREDAICIKRGWHWKDVEVTEHIMLAGGESAPEPPNLNDFVTARVEAGTSGGKMSNEVGAAQASVSDMIELAVQAEREECAKLVSANLSNTREGRIILAAIRSRASQPAQVSTPEPQGGK